MEKKLNNKFAEFAESVAEQNEDMHQWLSENMQAVIYWRDKFVSIDEQHKEYVIKAEAALKDLNTRVNEQMTDIVKNFGRKEGFKDISAFEKDVQAAIEEASGKF